MAIGDWSAAELCQDSDLQALESSVLEWTRGEGGVKKWRDEAKNQLEHELRQHLASTDKVINASVVAGEDRQEVLDLIADLAPLKYTACYLSLHLLCNNCSGAEGDFYDRKAEMYWQKYQQELPRGLSLLSIDTDESGTVSESERYYDNSGVRLSR
jgi:hypothetical protein